MQNLASLMMLDSRNWISVGYEGNKSILVIHKSQKFSSASQRKWLIQVKLKVDVSQVYFIVHVMNNKRSRLLFYMCRRVLFVSYALWSCDVRRYKWLRIYKQINVSNRLYPTAPLGKHSILKHIEAKIFDLISQNHLHFQQPSRLCMFALHFVFSLRRCFRSAANIAIKCSHYTPIS